jgi:hypothetical protein
MRRKSTGDYPDNWNEIALAIKEKWGWKCERCGRERGEATCPDLPSWGPLRVTPEFVRASSRFREFSEAMEGR